MSDFEEFGADEPKASLKIPTSLALYLGGLILTFGITYGMVRMTISSLQTENVRLELQIEKVEKSCVSKEVYDTRNLFLEQQLRGLSDQAKEIQRLLDRRRDR